MNPADAQFVEQIQQVTRGGSRLLVTLARHGKTLQRDDPQRSKLLLAAVANHPFYKGGRLAFDMLEIEDLMLDGSPVTSMSKPEVIQVLLGGAHRLVEMLGKLGSPAQGDGIPAEASGQDVDVFGPRRAPAQSAEEPAAAPLLPRVSLGPTDEMARPENRSAMRDEGRDTREKELQLQSSDYLYDYVVLGLLVTGAGIRAFESQP